MKPVLILLSVVAFSVCISVSGCSRPGSLASAASNTMTQSVQAKFADEPALADVRVNADAVHNCVILSGSVPSEVARTEAVDRAKSIAVVPVVIDKIEVLPAGDESARDRIARSVGGHWLAATILDRADSGLRGRSRVRSEAVPFPSRPRAGAPGCRSSG